MKRLLLICVVAVLLWSPCRAQDTIDARLSDSAFASILTCGAGDEFYTTFGHSAIRVCDPTTGLDLVYNYGTFDFDIPHFYWTFARGKLNYCLSRTSFDNFMAEYAFEGRAVWEQRLRLSQQELNNLLLMLETNYLPEYRYYMYDFFRDNCATRVRDMVRDCLCHRTLSPECIADTNLSYRNLLYRSTEGTLLWWRLGYVACVLLSFVGSSFNFLWFLPGQYLYFHVYFWGIALIIAYVLLAVLMPVAETPEDRLRMKGKEVNPQNLAEEIVEQNNTAEASTQQYATTTPGHKGPSGCVSSTFGCIGGFFVALWTVVVTLFRWCLYAFGAFVAVMCLVGIVCLTAFAVNPYELLGKGSDFFKTPEFAALVPSLTAPFYIFVVAAFLVLAITAYAIIHSLLNEFKQMQSMPYRQRIVLLVSWILGLIVAGVAFGYGVPKFIEVQGKYDRERWQELDAQYREEHTHDGIFVPDDEWEWLQDNGWKILNAEGCNDRFTAHGEYMTGDYSVRYLDCWDDHHRQRYRVERTDTLRPGTYRLTCAARANGTGACVYVIVGDEKPQFIEIPATGNKGGSIWEEANQFVQSHPNIAPDSVEYGNKLCELIDVNNGKGFGWNRITIEPIHITKPTALRYGLTSDDAFTGKTWLGQYFSATDFEVSLFEDATRRREAKNPTPQTSEVASQDSSSVQDGRMVIVRRGETLAIIARRNHTTVGRLRQLNHLHNNHVRVGQRLRVR